MQNKMNQAGLTWLIAALGLAAVPVWAEKAPEQSAVEEPAHSVNAAPRYWQGIYLLDAAIRSNPQVDELAFKNGGDPLDPKQVEGLRQFVAQNAEATRLFIDASRSEGCDFVGDSVERDGPAALLPHLGGMRRGAHLLIASALIDAQEGRHTESAETIAAVFRMARHMQNDRVLISSLVGSAIFQVAARAAGWGLDRGHFTSADKAAIAVALTRFSADDPFAMRAAIRGERDCFLGWIRRTYTPGAPLPPQAEEFFKSLFTDPCDDSSASVIRKTIERKESIEPYIRLAWHYYDRVLEAWESPDPAQTLNDLNDQLNSGTFGPLTSIVAPSTSSVLKSDTRARAALSTIRERLRD